MGAKKSVRSGGNPRESKTTPSRDPFMISQRATSLKQGTYPTQVPFGFLTSTFLVCLNALAQVSFIEPRRHFFDRAFTATIPRLR